MQDIEVFRQLLGLMPPWEVTRVELKLAEGHVDVFVWHAPGTKFPGGGAEDFSWRSAGARSARRVEARDGARRLFWQVGNEYTFLDPATAEALTDEALTPEALRE